MPADPNSVTKLKVDALQDPFVTGEVFYLNNSGVGPQGSAVASDNNTGLSPVLPLSTLAGALDKCVASRGDVIVIMPGHAETATAQIDIDVAGVSIVGVGEGSLRPTFTGNGTIDLFDVSAANVRIENLFFNSPSTDAQTAHVNIDAGGVTLKNCEFLGSETGNNVVDCITLTANAENCSLLGLLMRNTTVAVNSFISIEGAIDNLRIHDTHIFGEVVAGGIIDAAAATHVHFKNLSVGVTGTTKAAIVLDSNPTGMIDGGRFSGTITTLASNANYGNALRLFDCLVLEETDASAQGALIPAVDAN